MVKTRANETKGDRPTGSNSFTVLAEVEKTGDIERGVRRAF